MAAGELVDGFRISSFVRGCRTLSAHRTDIVLERSRGDGVLVIVLQVRGRRVSRTAGRVERRETGPQGRGEGRETGLRKEEKGEGVDYLLRLITRQTDQWHTKQPVITPMVEAISSAHNSLRSRPRTPK